MTQKDRFLTIGRRDALGFIAAAVATEVVSVGPLRAAKLSAVPAAGAAPKTGSKLHLAELTADHFDPLVGKSFAIGDHTMTLRRVRRGHNSGPQFRQQFGIVFEALHDLPLRSEILPLSHPALGRYDVLVGPVGASGSARLEVCFA